MTTVLTIDTSSSRCAVALQRGDVLLARQSEAERQSAQRVLPMISELLQEAGLTVAELDLIAVVAGPGSFTGVRIGVAVAQGLAMSGAIPVVPLSSMALLAMACNCERVLICEEAREEELYFAAYQRSEQRGVTVVGREQVARIAELTALPADLSNESWCLAGNGWAHRAEILKQLGCSKAEDPCEPTIEDSTIAKLGLLRFQCGEAVEAAQLRPNYVKEQLDYS